MLKSNQIIFIGLRSSKDYYKRPRVCLGIWEGSLGCAFLRGWMCAEGMGCGKFYFASPTQSDDVTHVAYPPEVCETGPFFIMVKEWRREA